jgi:hypothetical protein
MNAGCERVCPTPESLSAAPELEVLLKHEYAAATLRQRRCSDKSADSGPDNDDIEARLPRFHTSLAQ